MLLGHDKIMFFTQSLKARRKQSSNIQVNAIFAHNKIDVNKKLMHKIQYPVSKYLE